jgi:hypothetical protein
MQPIIEVQVIWEPMHQYNDGVRSRVFSDVDAVFISLHKSFFVRHDSIQSIAELTVVNRAL